MANQSSLYELVMTFRKLLLGILLAIIFFLSDRIASKQKAHHEAENNKKGYSLCISQTNDTCNCSKIFLNDTTSCQQPK